MADIKVSGRTKVKSFYNAFIKEFPYLHASLKYPDGKGVDMNASIANARAKSLGGEYSPTGNTALSIRGNLNIGTFEKRFQKERLRHSLSCCCCMYTICGGKYTICGGL